MFKIISILGSYFKIIDQKSRMALDYNFLGVVLRKNRNSRYNNQKWFWGNKDKTIIKNLNYKVKTLVLKPLGM